MQRNLFLSIIILVFFGVAVISCKSSVSGISTDKERQENVEKDKGKETRDIEKSNLKEKDTSQPKHLNESKSEQPSHKPVDENKVKTTPDLKFTISQDGKNIWPPKGPGCEKLVTCCTIAEQQSKKMGLACQIAIAAKKGDCLLALDSVLAILSEQGLSKPKECE